MECPFVRGLWMTKLNVLKFVVNTEQCWYRNQYVVRKATWNWKMATPPHRLNLTSGKTISSLTSFLCVHSLLLVLGILNTYVQGKNCFSAFSLQSLADICSFSLINTMKWIKNEYRILMWVVLCEQRTWFLLCIRFMELHASHPM